MARARNIKPGLFKNELLGSADPMLTILFTSLWCLADREGRLEDRPLRIKAETFPYRDNVDVNGYLTELQRLGFIQRYEANGKRLIQVLCFKKHQSPHHTEKASTLPPPPAQTQAPCDLPDDCVDSPLKDGEQTQSLPPDSLIPDSLIPDSLIEDSVQPDASGAPPASKSPARPKRIRKPRKVETPLPEDFDISERVRQWASRKGHGQLELHLENFVSVCKKKGYTYVDWDEALMDAIRKDWAKLGAAPGTPSGVGAAWYQTESGILRKGAERGLQPLRGERIQDFRWRIESDIQAEALGERKQPREPPRAVTVAEPARVRVDPAVAAKRSAELRAALRPKPKEEGE